MRVFILLLIAFPAFAQVGLRNPAFVASLNHPAASAGSCDAFSSATAQNATWAVDDGDSRAGQGDWTEAAPHTICGADVMLSLGGGDISAKTYRVKIYAEAGSRTLGALLATSDPVTGNNSWSSTVVQFTFSTPYVTTGSTEYHFTVEADQAPDGVNFANLHRSSTTSSIPGGFELWDDVGATTFGTFTEDIYLVIKE